jgi:iron complex outermembrane recepter protein
LSYQDKQFVEILNLAYLPSRTLLDLNFSATSPDENWSLTLWGKNVTDEVIISNSFFIGFVNQYTPTLAPGAAWGLTAKYKFNKPQ